MSNLLKKIGRTSIDHSAFMIQSGQMENVLAIFKELGWTEDSPLSGETFEVRFVRPEGSATRVQLTEHFAETFKEPLRGSHFGLIVKDPMGAAEALVEFAKERGWNDAKMEPANIKQTKWWVTIASIMAFKIELVPERS